MLYIFIFIFKCYLRLVFKINIVVFKPYVVCKFLKRIKLYIVILVLSFSF